MISLQEAHKRILGGAHTLDSIDMPVGDATDHVLAKPLIARLDQPRFDASAMDGYALRRSDFALGKVFSQIGVSQAGQAFDGMVGKDECVRIFTGAPVPEGADCVIIQEDSQVTETGVVFDVEPRPHQHIRAKGREFHEGQEICSPGCRLSPAHIMLAASANNTSVHVYRRPLMSLLATGNELVLPGTTPKPGQIMASNSFGLVPLFSYYCDDIVDFGVVPDNEEQLARTLGKALNGNSDVIVTTGGASVGDHDLVQPVLKSLGVEVDFWKISMRPGKPLLYGRYGEKHVFSLPGNPVSAMVNAIVVVLPLLRAIAGNAVPVPEPLTALLSKDLPANGRRMHFIRCKIGLGENGLTAEPMEETDSSHISSLTEADALIQYEPDAPATPAGTRLPFIPLPWWKGYA